MSTEREITLRIKKYGIEVCTHPELTKLGFGLVSMPYKLMHGKKTTVEAAIEYLEAGWNAKATIMSDYRGKLAEKEHIVMRRRQLRARTKKFNYDLPQDGIVHWRPPDGFYPFWHAWIHTKTKNNHGYFPSKAEIKELVPILNSITGGSWGMIKTEDGEENMILQGWTPETKPPGIFSFEGNNEH